MTPQARPHRPPYRTIEIQAGQHVLTAADPFPHDLQAALTKIKNVGSCAH